MAASSSYDDVEKFKNVVKHTCGGHRARMTCKVEIMARGKGAYGGLAGVRGSMEILADQKLLFCTCSKDERHILVSYAI